MIELSKSLRKLESFTLEDCECMLIENSNEEFYPFLEHYKSLKAIKITTGCKEEITIE